MKEILLLLLGIFVIGNCQGHKKVLLADVNTITLKDGKYTTGRRNAPVPQMKCVGGGAAHKYKPKVAQCTKTGFDGFDFQWRCTAEMPTEYEFGKITVSCEGFDHPDDPYILYGSCGLEYDLEYTADLKRNDAIGAHDPVNKFGTYLVIAFIICVVLYMIFTKDSEENRRRRSGGGGGGGPGYPPDSGYPDEKPPRGFPTPPPSYDESMGEARQRTNQQREEQAYQYRTMGFGGQQRPGNNGPGFWTGAGLGALGGYMFGRQQQAEPTRHTASYSQRRHTPPPSSSSGDMHQSTGYGGTSRR